MDIRSCAIHGVGYAHIEKSELRGLLESCVRRAGGAPQPPEMGGDKEDSQAVNAWALGIIGSGIDLLRYKTLVV